MKKKNVVGIDREFETFDVALMDEPEDLLNDMAEFIYEFENIEQAKGFVIGTLKRLNEKWTYGCVIQNKFEININGENLIDTKVVFEAYCEDYGEPMESKEENEHDIRYS